MTTTPWQDRPVVYRIYSARGACLYVGATRNVEQRIEHHRRMAPFGQHIARVRLTIHPNYQAALEHESAEILALRPKYNIRGRGHRNTWQASDFAEVIEALEFRTPVDGNPSAHARMVERLRNDFRRRFPAVAQQIDTLGGAA